VSTDAVERERVVKGLLDEIVDPCSVVAGTPIGLLQMGIVDAVDVHGDDVSIKLLPTFPGCIYTAVFAGEIERRLAALDWPAAIEVSVIVDGQIWDEDRMSPEARERLRVARAERRRRAQLVGR
jgi:ring-1,2-phenylacetyl-CoA epoxidase subunit PaaD